MNMKDIFLQEFQREHKTTVNVLKAYPEDKRDMKPTHEKTKSARELAWMFVAEEKVLMGDAIRGKMDFAAFQHAPATMKEIISEFEKVHAETAELIKSLSEEDLKKPIDFYVGPKTPGKIPLSNLLWMGLYDQIHHRGQFSIYLRLAGAKVPSIYGPTADEPWN